MQRLWGISSKYLVSGTFSDVLFFVCSTFILGKYKDNIDLVLIYTYSILTCTMCHLSYELGFFINCDQYVLVLILCFRCCIHQCYLQYMQDFGQKYFGHDRSEHYSHIHYYND